MIAVARRPTVRAVPRPTADCAPGAPGPAFVLFLVLTAVLFLRPTEIVPALDGVPIFQAVILACLSITFPWVVRQLTWSAIVGRPITACVLGVAAAVPVSRLGNGGGTEAIAVAAEFGKVVIYYLLLLAVVDTPRRLHALVVWLLACLAIHTGLSLSHFHGLTEIPAMNPVYDRVVNNETGEAVALPRICGVGLFGNPNDLSRILVVGIALAVYLVGRWPRTALPALLALIGMFGYALTMTQSRGGLVALAVTVLIGMQVRFGGRRTALLALAALPITSIAVGGRQTDLSTEEGTGQQRIQLWLEGFGAVRESPVIGIGAERYAEVTGGLGAHNSFVECYVELGLIGGTCFLSAFVLALWQTYRLGPDRVRGLASSLAAIHPFVVAIVGGYGVGLLTSSRNYVMPTYLLLGLAAVYQQLAARSSSRPVPRLDGRTVVRLVLVCGLIMGALYVAAQSAVRWG